LWEIGIKYGLKKLSLNGLSPEEFFIELGNSFYLCKDISNLDIITNYQLPMYHKDPFDRFLIWEAIRNNLVLMSIDNAFNPYMKYGLRVEN
jgi:PIN domain nuclease of toxin-antitoxin system